MNDSDIRILYIDKSQENHSLLKEIISEIIPNSIINTALDCNTGLRIARTDEPDLVLLDLDMPCEEVLNVIRQLKHGKYPDQIPVISLTSPETSDQTRTRAMEAGAEVFLSKPPDKDELTTRIMSFLKRKAVTNHVRPDKEYLERLISERTKEIENELLERKKTEEELRKANQKLRQTQIATLNLLEDLKIEMTAREESDAALIKAKERAEESDRLKSAFLANMSHEIRTPMNGIIGFSGLLNDPELDTEDRDRFIRIINDNCQQLLHIISDLIDISKIEAGLIEPEPVEFCLNDLMDSLYESYQLKTLSKGLRLNLFKDLVCNACSIMADQGKLRQVVENLLINSIKFTEKGEINFGYKLEGERIRFFVEDTGIGIAPEHKEAIFNRFWQVETGLARQYGGTGLGLSISNAYVNKMGGEIMLESTLGKGSCFSFTLPYSHSGKLGSRQSEVRHDLPDFKGKTILVVEDEPDNFEFLEIILGRQKFKLLHAWNGKEAIKIFEANPEIDLVLMDFKLPDMPGQEITKDFIRQRPSVPVIATTAYAMSGDREKAIQAGCLDYIAKPIRQDELVGMLSKHIRYSAYKEDMG